MSDVRPPGAGLVDAGLLGTLAFVVTALAGLVAPDAFGVAATVVSLVLFAAGCATFLWAYAVAIGRSRSEQVDLAGVFLLDRNAPRVVRWRLRGALVAQVVVGIGAASLRPFTSTAFGVLVPMFGLGLMGAWGARHGTFPAKDRSDR